MKSLMVIQMKNKGEVTSMAEARDRIETVLKAERKVNPPHNFPTRTSPLSNPQKKPPGSR